MSIWDEPLDDKATNDYPVLPAGTYEFQVENVTAKEYLPKPKSKIGRCAQIDLRLRVESPDGTEVRVFESLFSDTSTAWKMTAFAKCIGVFHAGMTPGELAKKANSGIGTAEFILETYNGKQRNRVKTYIMPPEPVPAITIDSEDLPF